MLNRLLLSLAACLIAAGQAWAAPGTFDTGTSSPSLTRPANTTAYAANSLVCASSCAALSFQAAPAQDSGSVYNVQLWKSGTSTTSATFKLFYFSAAPSLGSLADGSAYSGPFIADKGIYLGSAICGTAQSSANSDGVSYDCSLSSNALPFRSANGKLYVIVTVTGAYTPASGETFTVRSAGFLD